MVEPVTVGLATMYLGDCYEILSQISDVALVVTSPPYNQLGKMKSPGGMWADKGAGRGFVDNWAAAGYSDDMPEDGYQAWQNALFERVLSSCRPDASLFYNHQLRWRDGECLHPVQWFSPEGWRLRSEIIWDRCGGMMFNARMFVRFDERILWFTRGAEYQWNQEYVGWSTIWRIPKEQNKSHPVAFPIALPRRCILAASNRGDVVMDPFSGSASTGVAAVQNGRRYIGIESSARYFDDACRRLEDAQRQGSFMEALTK